MSDHITTPRVGVEEQHWEQCFKEYETLERHHPKLLNFESTLFLPGQACGSMQWTKRL